MVVLFIICCMYLQCFCPVTVQETPSWFEAFLARYNSPVFLHVTLTQCRIVASAEREHIHNLLTTVVDPFRDYFPFEVAQSSYRVDDSGEDAIIMYDFVDDTLVALQRAMAEALYGYPLQDAEMAVFERSFVPHLTIATKIPTAKLQDVCAEYNLRAQYFALRVGAPIMVATDAYTAEAFNDLTNHLSL